MQMLVLLSREHIFHSYLKGTAFMTLSLYIRKSSLLWDTSYSRNNIPRGRSTSMPVTAVLAGLPPILSSSLLRTLSLRGKGRDRRRWYFFTIRPLAARKGDGVVLDLVVILAGYVALDRKRTSLAPRLQVLRKSSLNRLRITTNYI